MAKRSEERQIGGQTWMVTQFGSTEGLAVMARLFKMVGPTIGKAVSAIPTGTIGGTGGILDMDVKAMNMAMLGEAVEALASRLDEHEVVALVKRMLADVRVNGAEVLPQFDLVFMGDYPKLFSVLKFVLEVNYGNFFDGANAKSVLSAIAKKSELQ
jgi:hypothetical protein